MKYFLYLILGISLILAGCNGPTPAEENETTAPPAPEEPTTMETKDISIMRITSLEYNSPATMLVGKDLTHVSVLDLESERYVYFDPGIGDENFSVIKLYLNGTSYKAVNLGDVCFISSIQRDFYNMQDDELSLGLFLFVESIIKQTNETYQEEVKEFEQSLEENSVGNNLYKLNLSGFENSTFKKYGSSYYGNDVTIISSNIKYSYSYDVKEITKSEFDSFLNDKIDMVKNCSSALEGQENPFG